MWESFQKPPGVVMNNETKVKHCGKFPFHPDTLQIGALKAQPKSRTCVPCLRLHFGQPPVGISRFLVRCLGGTEDLKINKKM